MSLSPWFRLLLCCCLFSPLALSAQDSHLAEAAAPIPALENYFKESLNTRDGLPHNTINAIAQTPDGSYGLLPGKALPATMVASLKFMIAARLPVCQMLASEHFIWTGIRRYGLRALVAV